MTKLWFAGTGKFAASCLERLDHKLDIVLAVTSPPTRVGRKYRLKPSPLESKALEAGLNLHRTESFSEDAHLLNLLDREPPDAVIVVDFGQMIREPFLSFSEGGCLNIHPSLLPLYRGAAPVQRALLDGIEMTGVTVFRLDQGMDSGPIAASESMKILDNDNGSTLAERLAETGSNLMVNVVGQLSKGALTLKVQKSQNASYAPKIEKTEARLSFSEKALDIHNRVRALNPEPGAFAICGGKRLKVWETTVQDKKGVPGQITELEEGYPLVGTQSGSILLITVQPEGKKVISGRDWVNGLRIRKGDTVFD